MHPSAYAHMARCIQRYLPSDKPYRVVDLGARRVQRQPRTFRELLQRYEHVYIGVDIKAGPNVDLVMRKPYSIPVPSGSIDVVLSGQTFEHIPFPWVSMLEIGRILKPGGYLFVTAPSRGHPHGPLDCWRYYPDGFRALAAFSGLDVVEAQTDFPPRVNGRRHDYSAIDTESAYWGDTVGVFRKSPSYPTWPTAAVRKLIVWWANRQDELGARSSPTRASAG